MVKMRTPRTATGCSRNRPGQSTWLAQQSKTYFASEWQSLVATNNKQRCKLVEVRCSPAIILTTTMQQLCNDEQAAARCSHWNDCDVGTGAGVKNVLKIIENLKHSLVWISADCGPYSPLQNLNQRTEQQRHDLFDKTQTAIKQYMGCIVIAKECRRLNIQVAWELAERCDAWRLPFMQKLVADA
jgi:hypothetical protein